MLYYITEAVLRVDKLLEISFGLNIPAACVIDSNF